MPHKTIQPGLSVTGQIQPSDLEALYAKGFRSVICNRPDGEGADQPDWALMEAEAVRLGMGASYLPVGGEFTAQDQAAAFAAALKELPGPVIAYCRTGNRSEQTAKAARKFGGAPNRDGGNRYQILIVGGGSAGIATAASLLKRRRDLDIAIVEPKQDHFYQPGFTMVGGGVFKQSDTIRPTSTVMPHNAKWICASVSRFDPANNSVTLSDGSTLSYDQMIVAMGNRIAWEAIDGLEEALGRDGVTSNYRYDLAPYTWRLVQQMAGGKALFTQPPMPIKCAGAPQKAMYLSCSEWESKGRLADIDVEFHNAGGVLFGVPDYVPALMDTVERYGIGLKFGSNLIAVDGPAHKATFRTDAGEVSVDYDMLHVVPPQQAHPIVADSDLSDGSGYVEVDPTTLRHTRYPNIFGLGDGCNTSNAKTAAAARKQAPVVAVNVLAALEGGDMVAGYDGYGSCPLTVDRGHIVLAEFLYGGKVAPTLPTWLINGLKPSKLAWHLKADALPPIYWHGMLKGREWLVPPVPLQ